MPSLACKSSGACVLVDSAEQRAQSHYLCLTEQHALNRLTGPVDQLVYLAGGLAKASEHVCGDDLWIGGFGSSDADPHTHEVSAAELPLERLQAVVTGKPTASRVRTSPNGRSISS